MSTSGIAHHQRKTFAIGETDEDRARAARYAEQDAAYRAALGLNRDDPLPRQIGLTNGSGSATRHERCQTTHVPLRGAAPW